MNTINSHEREFDDMDEKLAKAAAIGLAHEYIERQKNKITWEERQS